MNLETRLIKLRKILSDSKLDAVLITSTPNIQYLTSYGNFSSKEREAYLLITKDKQYILTDGRYETAIKKEVQHFEYIPISAKIPAAKAISEITKSNKIQVLGIEDRNLTVYEQKKLSEYKLKTQAIDLNTLRIIKDKNEIQIIENACKLGDKAFKYILKKIKVGTTEKELASELEIFIIKNGGQLAFPSIVAYGQNAAIPHHATSSKKLIANSLILLDFGVKIDGYCSDMTRTVFLGRATNEQKHIYETVFTAQQKAIELIESIENNIIASDIDKASRDYILSQGYPSIPHSLGHGIGLQVHELPYLSPVSDTKLKPGMVFSIEPGIYLPGKTGVRIEDLFVIEKDGLHQLTQSSKRLIELSI